MGKPFVSMDQLFNLTQYNLQQIFSYFTVYELANLLLVCRLWRTRTPTYWSCLDFSKVYITSCACMLKLAPTLKKFVRHGTTGMTKEELDAFSAHSSLVECVIPSSAASYLVSPKVSKITLLHKPTVPQLEKLKSLPALRELIIPDDAIDGSLLNIISQFPQLKSFSFRVYNTSYMNDLLPMRLFTGLQKLDIVNANDRLACISTLTNLRSLSFDTKNLPDLLFQFTQLTQLHIRADDKLQTVDKLHELCNFPNLDSLRLLTCGNKGDVFTSLYSTSLRKLEVCDYNSSRTCALPGLPIKLPKLKEVRLVNISLKHNIKIAFSKSQLVHVTLNECVIEGEDTWISISSFPELQHLSILSCDKVNDNALKILSKTPNLRRLQIVSKPFEAYTITGLTHLTSCATLRNLDLSVYPDDESRIRQNYVERVFARRKDVSVAVTLLIGRSRIYSK